MSDDPDKGRRELRSAVRLRNRAVAEREASRLARPDQPSKSRTLGHASKSKSAVTSTPFGIAPTKRNAATGQGEDVTAEQWCGPFSVARQMIAAREEARTKREAEQRDREHHPLDEVVLKVEEDKKRKANPSMLWKGKVDETTGRSNYYMKRKKRFARQKEGMSMSRSLKVPTLYKLCVDFLVENFEFVEGLGAGIGADIRRSICESLVAKGKMNGAAFDTIAEVGVETLEIIDCAEVTQDQLCIALDSLIPSGLQALILNHAGRAFGPKAVDSIVSSSPNSLFALSIGGAYLLKDADANALIEATAPTLSSIEFKACPLIGPSFCSSIGENFASSVGRNCLLELSLEDIPLTKDCLLTIGSASDALQNLKSLRLRQIEGLDDDAVSIMLNATRCLEAIDLGDNPLLTDSTLSAVRKSNKSGALRALQLSGLKNLSSAGLEVLFTPDIPGLPSPPKLKKLNLSSCGEDAVSDDILELAAKASSMKAANNDTLHRKELPPPVSGGTSSLGGLVDLNVSGSSITDKSMENLAASCSSSIVEIDLSFCPHVSDKGLGFLVSKVGYQLAKINIWGNAQISDLFLDGHGRVDEGGLEIIGAWMKQSGKRSLR